ncbi:MAG: diacylglycerol kinase family protein [Candidatus Moranbacteria bacterium]|nr:diacylglycerol kinase family protein [Candidatus Moranbacteria bacterium]
MKKFAKSFSHAANGIRQVYRSERNFRIESVLGIFVLLLSCLLPLSRTEWITVLLTIGLVLSFEILNTAVERLMDMLQPEFHHEVKIIKDLSAAAVLTVSIFAWLVGLVVFVPYIIRLTS